MSPEGTAKRGRRGAELPKKLVHEGANAAIINDDRALNGNELGFCVKGEQRVIVKYSFGGLSTGRAYPKIRRDSVLMSMI